MIWVDADNRNLGDVGFCVLSGDDIDDVLLARMTLLLKESFERWPLFELPVLMTEYLRWQIEGPSGETSMIVIGKERSEIVSMNVVLKRRYLLCGEPIKVWDGINSCVHPAHRGRGIFSARRSFQERRFGNQFRVEIGYTQHPAILHHWRARNHYPPANVLQLLARPLNPRALAREEFGTTSVRRVVGPITSWAVWGLSRASSCRYRRSVPSCQSFKVVVIERFDERADRLFEKASGQFDFIQVRDERHLNWRYCDVRSGGFTVLGIEEGDDLLGYLVLKIYRERGYIADILSLPGRQDVVRRLVEEAIRRMRDRAAVAVCWLPRQHPYAPLLRGLGFIDARRPIGIGVRPLDLTEVQERVFRDPKGALHVMQGDSDTV